MHSLPESHLTHCAVCLIYAGPMFNRQIKSCPEMSIIFTEYDVTIVDFSTDVGCQTSHFLEDV